MNLASKIKRFILSVIMIMSVGTLISQEQFSKIVFKSQPINFGGEIGEDTDVVRLQNGRVIYKKVNVPKFLTGTDVTINLKLRSNGDRWDKSGSCFVVTNPDAISILNVSEGKQQFPLSSGVNGKYKGVLPTENYEPSVEVLRFMTPFGVGFYSDNSDKHRKPVYIPHWEKEVVWKQDISDLTNIVSGEFYVGIWIDSWTKEGYEVDLSFTYSNREKPALKVIPLVNTVPYVSGQSLPDFFAEVALKSSFELPENTKNVKLHYITTGHGGHSGGDEFIKIRNSVYVDGEMVIDTIPWRDDCASFRRFNPTSGVWLKKDTATYIDFETRSYKVKEIEERIASSDLSRSNWCPGSLVEPIEVDLGNMKAGNHTVKVEIPATKASGDKQNHWLVSAYLTYEE